MFAVIFAAVACCLKSAAFVNVGARETGRLTEDARGFDRFVVVVDEALPGTIPALILLRGVYPTGPLAVRDRVEGVGLALPPCLVLP